jgi:hypothetical protein
MGKILFQQTGASVSEATPKSPGLGPGRLRLFKHGLESRRVQDSIGPIFELFHSSGVEALLDPLGEGPEAAGEKAAALLDHAGVETSRDNFLDTFLKAFLHTRLNPGPDAFPLPSFGPGENVFAQHPFYIP